jgi:hypothetical protein
MSINRIRMSGGVRDGGCFRLVPWRGCPGCLVVKCGEWECMTHFGVVDPRKLHVMRFTELVRGNFAGNDELQRWVA